MPAIRASISGRVQGVGYRFTARRMAAQLGVTGWARNAADGSVEVLAQGSEESLTEFRRFLERGPAGAVVRSVDVTDAEVDETLSGFHITF